MEDEIVKIVMSTLSIISSVLSLFVFFTFLLFSEKRKTSTDSLILFQSLMLFFLQIVMIVAAFNFTKETYQGSIACLVQGTVFLFCGNATQISCFFITLNLFRRFCLEIQEISSFLLMAIILMISSISTAVPLSLDRIVLEDYWCFISSNDIVLIFGCFYGLLIAISLIGTLLWFLIMRKIILHSKLEMNLEEVGRHATLNGPYDDKVHMLIRQFVYVTAYLFIFYVMMANRIYTSIAGTTDGFARWLTHSIGLLGDIKTK